MSLRHVVRTAGATAAAGALVLAGGAAATADTGTIHAGSVGGGAGGATASLSDSLGDFEPRDAAPEMEVTLGEGDEAGVLRVEFGEPEHDQTCSAAVLDYEEMPVLVPDNYSAVQVDVLNGDLGTPVTLGEEHLAPELADGKYMVLGACSLTGTMAAAEVNVPGGQIYDATDLVHLQMDLANSPIGSVMELLPLIPDLPDLPDLPLPLPQL